MNSFHLHPAKTALVIIDLQQGIVAIPAVPHPSSEIVQKSALLAKHLREKGGTVVYVRVDIANVLQLPVDAPSRASNAPPPPPSASELIPAAGFQQGDLLITKRHWGAFAGTELENALRQRGIATVILTGISTNFGVESTARQGTGLGFAFVIVEDACGSRDADDHRFAFEKIFPRLARVRKTDEVLAALA
ncbi:MAG TPA: isochorismatase family protein [Candidatus Sulfotelmatobacter sp.]|nr:isochorismatase family protein [Candidatus Sulfotelmatobacter sp.]